MAWCIFLVAIGLNFVWEMGQMLLYTGMKSLSPRPVMFCTVASIGDAVYTLLLFWIVRRILRSARPPRFLTASRIAYVAGSGAITAVIVERVGLQKGLWAYNSAMPKIPLLGVGILPVLQLASLPLLTFYIVKRSFFPHNSP